MSSPSYSSEDRSPWVDWGKCFATWMQKQILFRDGMVQPSSFDIRWRLVCVLVGCGFRVEGAFKLPELCAKDLQSWVEDEQSWSVVRFVSVVGSWRICALVNQGKVEDCISSPMSHLVWQTSSCSLNAFKSWRDYGKYTGIMYERRVFVDAELLQGLVRKYPPS